MKSFIIATLLFASQAFAGFNVPEMNHPVNDYANVLTPSGKEAIAKMIVTLKEGTKAQLGVLIINTLDGDNLEAASFRAAKAWKLGDKRDSDGVLLFVVVQDRKMRIEVGTGLESTLTDARSKQILAGMKPALRAKNYDLAIAGAVDSIFSTISAASAENSIQHAPSAPAQENNDSTVLWILGILGAVGVVGFLIRKGIKDAAEQERQYRESQKQYKEDLVRHNAYVASMTKQGKTAHKPAPKKPRRSEDDDYSSSRKSSSFVGVFSSGSSDSGSSYSSSDSSSSSSDWGGGGGDFSGGGSSDSW